MALQFAKVQNYLSRLGLKCANVELCQLSGRVPLSLSEVYEARFCNLQGLRYLFLLPRGEKPAPDIIVHQAKSLEKYYPERQILLFSEMDAEYYDWLCRNEIAFVVPGRIAHVPGLVELKADNAFAAQEPVLGKHLSPWAQVVLLFHILKNHGRRDLPYARLAKELHVNKVYLTRAAKELERRQLAKIEYSGTSGIIVFAHDGRALWRWAQEVLTSPVRKTIRTVNPPKQALRSGISALAERSMLVPDQFTTYAVVSADLNQIEKEDRREYEGDYVEGWKYDPTLLSGDDGLVDPLSLYLALRESADPRIEEAREAMLERVLW